MPSPENGGVSEAAAEVQASPDVKETTALLMAPPEMPATLGEETFHERFVTMKKITLMAAIALLAALGAQSMHAQGQSSGEDTQRPDRQATPAASVTQPDKARQSASSQSQQKPGPNTGSAGTAAQGSHSSAQAGSANKQVDPKPGASAPSPTTTGSSVKSNNDFKSDTAATGRIHEEGSPRQSSAAQGTAASGQSGNAKASSPPK
jgi:hypothetical protein